MLQLRLEEPAFTAAVGANKSAWTQNDHHMYCTLGSILYNENGVITFLLEEKRDMENGPTAHGGGRTKMRNKTTYIISCHRMRTG